MTNIALEIADARKHGYSDQEIANYLQKDATYGPQIANAQKAGYSTKEIVDQFARPPSATDTALKYSAGQGFANLLDAIPNAVVNANNLLLAGEGVLDHAITGNRELPETDPADTLSGWSKMFHAMGLINDDYAPTDAKGTITDALTQTLTGGGVNPRAILQNGVRGMVAPVVRDLSAAGASGITNGLAQVATKNVNTGNPNLDNAIKTIAPVLAGTAAGGTVAARSTAGERAAAATSGMTPQQLQAARQLAQDAAARGAPITAYEAMQQATGGINPKMQTQQRVVMQSDAAAKNLTPMMQARAANNARMVGQTLDQIAPPNAYPDTLGGDFKNAAQNAIQAERNNANAAAAPFYATSSNNPAVKIPQADWHALASDPGVNAALQAVKNDPFSGLQNATEGSVQWLDAAKKWLDSKSQAFMQSGDRYQAFNADAASRRITSAVDPLVPDYAQARQTYGNYIENYVTPLERGQLGKLSGSDDFMTQYRNLLPTKPYDVNENVISDTSNRINQQDPSILAAVLRQGLETDFKEANQGTNPMGGAKFAKDVADNPQQRANLVKALQEAGADPDLFTNTLDILHAQGYNPAPNSATTANAAESAKLGGPLSLITRPTQAIPNLLDSWRNGLSTKYLAQALSSGPSSVDDILGLARTNGAYDPFKQQVMVNALLGASPQQQEQAQAGQ